MILVIRGEQLRMMIVAILVVKKIVVTENNENEARRKNPKRNERATKARSIPETKIGIISTSKRKSTKIVVIRRPRTIPMIIRLPVRKPRPCETESAEGMTKIDTTTKEENAVSHLQNYDEGIILIEACHRQSRNHLMTPEDEAVNTNDEMR